MEILAGLQASSAVLSDSLDQQGHSVALQAHLAGEGFKLDGVVSQQLDEVKGLLSYVSLSALRFVVLAFVFKLLDSLSHQHDLVLQGSDGGLPVLNFFEISA